MLAWRSSLPSGESRPTVFIFQHHIRNILGHKLGFEM